MDVKISEKKVCNRTENYHLMTDLKIGGYARYDHARLEHVELFIFHLIHYFMLKLDTVLEKSFEVLGAISCVGSVT